MLKDKNLLVLSHTYNSFIKDPVEILARNFNKVYVLVRHQPISELGNIIPIPFFRNRAKYSKKYSIDLTNKPENVEVIPTSFFYLPTKNLYLKAGPAHFRKVSEIIERRNIEFDLIHAHFLWSAGYAGIKVKEKYNKPLVLTGHGYDVYRLPNISQGFREAIRAVLEGADRILTVSQGNKEKLKRLGCKDVIVFPNGFSRNLFYSVGKKVARAKLKLPFDRKILLTVGNLEEVKGYEYLIKALDLVREEEPDILCLHIGAGSLESKLKDMVEDLELQKNFRFLGRRPHETLVDYFGASDLFVSSSLAEGNPTVMFEALGCGRPFIGTKVGGVPEIIVSEEYGILSSSGDEKELAKNILRGLNRNWNSEKILSYGKKFSWENTCEDIIKVYEELL